MGVTVVPGVPAYFLVINPSSADPDWDVVLTEVVSSVCGAAACLTGGHGSLIRSCTNIGIVCDYECSSVVSVEVLVRVVLAFGLIGRFGLGCCRVVVLVRLVIS